MIDTIAELHYLYSCIAIIREMSDYEYCMCIHQKTARGFVVVDIY